MISIRHGLKEIPEPPVEQSEEFQTPEERSSGHQLLRAAGVGGIDVMIDSFVNPECYVVSLSVGYYCGAHYVLESAFAPSVPQYLELHKILARNPFNAARVLKIVLSDLTPEQIFELMQEIHKGGVEEGKLRTIQNFKQYAENLEDNKN